jgi:hypothetical protein
MGRWTDHYAESLAEQVEPLASATGALPKLFAVAQVGRTLEALTRALVADARREGCSWEAISRELGVSRQAAHERFSDAN